MCEKIEQNSQWYNWLNARTKLLKSCHHVLLLQGSVNSKYPHLWISTESELNQHYNFYSWKGVWITANFFRKPKPEAGQAVFVLQLQAWVLVVRVSVSSSCLSIRNVSLSSFDIGLFERDTLTENLWQNSPVPICDPPWDLFEVASTRWTCKLGLEIEHPPTRLAGKIGNSISMLSMFYIFQTSQD